MKSFRKLFAFTFLFAFICGSTTVFAASKDVNTFAEFESALMNQSITEINVMKSFTFTRNISKGIPNRDVLINGNADKGVQINSAQWSIYGKQNKYGKNTFSIVNANITGRGTPTVNAYTDGRFFTGGQENGPNAYGWDVYAKDVKYVGARFVHLSNGTLTFDGSNEIYTNCENAWVEHVVFKAGSTYKSSNSGTGDYGAFYFNKGKGIANGTATIESGAKTYFNLGTAVQPVFTGDVYKTTVEKDALFDVNCLGHAIWYVAGSRAFYQVGAPEFNVYGTVNIKQSENILNARSGKKNPNKNFYTPIYFAKSGEPELAGALNIKPGSNFYLTGYTNAKCKVGVIRVGKDFNLNIDQPNDFDIRNTAVDSVVISGNLSTHKYKINLNSDIKSWWKTSNGSYDDNNPYRSYTGIVGTINMKNYFTETNSTNNSNFNGNFWMHDYGRIALKGGVTNEYTVKFESNGGTLIQNQTVNENDLVIRPADPTKASSAFTGWFADVALTTPWNFGTDRVNSNITLYASWVNIPVTHEVEFISNGGTYVPTQIVDHNEFANKPADPIRTGYGFIGWFKEPALATPWSFDNDRVTSDVILYASWEKSDIFYKVEFESNGGSAVADQSVKKNDLVTKPTDPTKGTDIFMGWFTDSTLTSPWSFSTDRVTANIKLYASWTAKATGLYYVIEYRSSKGDLYAREVQAPVPAGTVITLNSTQLNAYLPRPSTHENGYQLGGPATITYNGQQIIVIYKAKSN